MGCCHSRIDRKEIVSRCKARKRYMKQLVKARQAFSASHSMYLRSLRGTGSALLQFATTETSVHHHPPRVLPQTTLPHQRPRPPPRPPLSPSSDTWTSITASPALPPPPPQSSGWDFWDPFVPPPAPSSSRSGTEEEWEEATTTASDFVPNAAMNAPCMEVQQSVTSGFSKDTTSGSTELAVVVRRNTKDLVEIVKELDEYFLKTADAGAVLSSLLEVPSPGFSAHGKGGKVYSYGCSLNPSLWTWSSCQKLDGIGNLGEIVDGLGHCSTVERLYAWEKKLCQEVKNAETLKVEHDKMVARLRKLEVKRGDYVKTEKTRNVVEKLESQMQVASQAIETTSGEIIKVRETELHPQLIELAKGLTYMWRSMYESHQVQTHIVQQFKYLNTVPSTEPTSEIHRQSTLQLELEVQQWHQSFCNLIKAHRDYIESLTGWLRLSLFQFSKTQLSESNKESQIYSLCEEWHLAVDRIPDKVASEGIKSFLTVMHAVVVRQAEEHKQKKKSDVAFRDFEKRAAELRSLESKYGLFSMPESSSKNPVMDKRAKVEFLRTKAEEEKTRHEKSVSITRAMTINNLQMGFPHVFQAMVGFSSVCMQAFEAVYNQAKTTGLEHDVKALLP